MNLFKALVDVLPSYPLQVASVASIEEAGLAAIVTLPDGAPVRVRTNGDVPTVGARVYIRNGVIEGPAADKPLATGTV